MNYHSLKIKVQADLVPTYWFGPSPVFIGRTAHEAFQSLALGIIDIATHPPEEFKC